MPLKIEYLVWHYVSWGPPFPIDNIDNHIGIGRSTEYIPINE